MSFVEKVYLLFHALLLSSTMANRHDLFALETKSWITDDDFKTILELSFRHSKCCNVFLSDPTGDTEALFDQFRIIYPHEYLLQRSAHECNGYLLLGSSDNEIVKSVRKIPSLSWKTEILIITNNIVPRNSRMFNDSTYELANVNIVSLSGMWKLSENYLKPRVFTKLDRYDEMEHNYHKINLRGREIRACSFFRPPMTYFRRTVNKMIDGSRVEVFITDTELERDGIEMQLFLIMAEKLNFTWTIRKPEGNYTYGRKINETMWEGGMIDMLRKGKADVAFAGIWITRDQSTFVHLSEPWVQVYLHFLVPRPQRTSSFWALSKPFSEDVWCLLIAAILSHSLYTYVRAWVDPKFPKRFRNFLITLTDLIGCLLSSSVPKTIADHRLQILLWQTAGWLIIAAYCSSLAASLADSKYESRIDTIPQFLAANLTWGKMGQIPPFRDYFDMTDPYSAQLPSRYRYVENYERWETFIRNGNFAILGNLVDTSFFPENNVANEDLKNYRLMKSSVGHFYAAFAIQPWLLKPVNRIMLWLKETGIATWHLRDVIRRRDNYNLREVLIEHDGYDGSIQVLGLTPLGAGFSLLIVGITIATLVFYLELKRAAGSASVRELLRDINSKRASGIEHERHFNLPHYDGPIYNKQKILALKKISP